MDAHVPQCQGVVRLSYIARKYRWPTVLAAIAWGVLLAFLPWWIGLPLWLGLVLVQLASIPRLHDFRHGFRCASWCGVAGMLVVSYRAFGDHLIGLVYTLLAALSGFSLLALMASWQDRKASSLEASAAMSPTWEDMALAPVGPTDTLITLQVPVWLQPDDVVQGAVVDLAWDASHRFRIGHDVFIEQVEERFSMSPGNRWFAWPITAGQGIVLYDRNRKKQYRMRGWQLYGWHADEAWLSRGDDHAPLALSHVLGQRSLEE